MSQDSHHLSKIRPTRGRILHAMHAHPRNDGGDAFIPDPGQGPAHTSDDLAELAAEEYLASATSGEAVAFDDRDRTTPEECGGPFTEEQIPEEVMAMLQKTPRRA